MKNAERLQEHLRTNFGPVRGPMTATEVRVFLNCTEVAAHKLVNKGIKDGWLVFQYLPRPKGKTGPTPKSLYLAEGL